MCFSPQQITRLIFLNNRMKQQSVDNTQPIACKYPQNHHRINSFLHSMHVFILDGWKTSAKKETLLTVHMRFGIEMQHIVFTRHECRCHCCGHETYYKSWYYEHLHLRCLSWSSRRYFGAKSDVCLLPIVPLFIYFQSYGVTFPAHDDWSSYDCDIFISRRPYYVNGNYVRYH